MLGKYGARLYEEQMMDHLLYQAVSPNALSPGRETSPHYSRHTHNSLWEVVRLYPSNNPSSVCFGMCGVYSTDVVIEEAEDLRVSMDEDKEYDVGE